MVEINLLPWQEHKLAFYKYFTVLSLLLVAGLISIMLSIAHGVLVYKLHRLQSRIFILQQQAVTLRKNAAYLNTTSHIPRESMAERIKLHQLNFIKLLFALRGIAAQGICLTRLDFKKADVQLLGMTDSLLDISRVMAYLQGLTILQKVALEKVGVRKGNYTHSFNIHGLLQSNLGWDQKYVVDADIIEE